MKIKQPESGHYTFWKCYIQGGPRTKQWHCFFRGAPKILKINPFDRYILGKCWQMKIKQPQSGHYTFWKCYIQDAPRKKQYHCFFRGAPKISRKSNFYTNQNKETKIKTLLYIMKMLYTGCSVNYAISLLLSRSTYKFQEKTAYIHAFSVNSGKSK